MSFTTNRRGSAGLILLIIFLIVVIALAVGYLTHHGGPSNLQIVEVSDSYIKISFDKVPSLDEILIFIKQKLGNIKKIEGIEIDRINKTITVIFDRN